MKNEVEVYSKILRQSIRCVLANFSYEAHVDQRYGLFLPTTVIDLTNTCHGFSHHGDLATDPMPPG